ncbi:hypothetical protein BGX24_007725 [Mortierella sp. AD032]|nr:hypothetical protein BGX24_007725 [Mortierella sp. AD032]
MYRRARGYQEPCGSEDWYSQAANQGRDAAKKGSEVLWKQRIKLSTVPTTTTYRGASKASTRTQHIVPRPPVFPVVQQAPRPTTRGTMSMIASHINLSQLQEKGKGDKYDLPKVLECFLKVVHKGHAFPQFAVGKLYFARKDVAQDSDDLWIIQDYIIAMEWFIKTVDREDADAPNEIGTYELHEYPIPRLFIILPKDISEGKPAGLPNNHFQLYFLCECGEHTKMLYGDNTNIPHLIHIAKHEGYDLQRPTEFFQKYGR